MRLTNMRLKIYIIQVITREFVKCHDVLEKNIQSPYPLL
ncbi:hypothetical protein MAQ5080_02167 [Marinomonas aquimarina]|uniref:Uncharacterized protein n=1 Tax=Marinomonas aquimarina TaxID=295068 RepID=A0A1A8TFL7_9GAMM|nr:hypothetical protein MAQ5080_02167 [Marinomonas aquimarina]